MAKGTAGKDARFFVGGTSTAMVDEACTELTTTTFQITDSARRIQDDDVTIVIEVNSVAQDPSTYLLDLNFGIVTFFVSETGNTITWTGNFLPRVQVGKLKNAALEDTRDTVDSTVLNEDAEDNTFTIRRARFVGERLEVDDNLFDTTSMNDLFQAETVSVWELDPFGDGTRVIRVRGFTNNFGYKNNVTGLVTVDFGIVAHPANQGNGESALISVGAV